MFHVRDDQIPLLPADLNGKNVVELGCGTAYVSAWAARRGARRVVGIDNSARQLETARRLADEYGVDVTLHHGIAEDTPTPSSCVETRQALWQVSEREGLTQSGGTTSAPICLSAPKMSAVPHHSTAWPLENLTRWNAWNSTVRSVAGMPGRGPLWVARYVTRPAT